MSCQCCCSGASVVLKYFYVIKIDKMMEVKIESGGGDGGRAKDGGGGKDEGG